MARLELRSATKRYGATPAVDSVSLDVADGDFLAVLGPSGCGKTTLLRMVAGFESVDAGEILLDGRVVSAPGRHLPAEQRRVGIVFQSYALWPHMNVAENVGYALRVEGVRGAAYQDRVRDALRRVGLQDFAGRRPADLSGGQQQRVALARCLVMEPQVVLLDEPLANLDVHLRAAMQEAFQEFHRATGATMVYITHDQAEAMAMANQVAVMHAGRVEQMAPPQALYQQPATSMVARFVGQSSVLPAKVLRMAEGRAGSSADAFCEVELLGLRATVGCQPGQPLGAAWVCLRPDDLRLIPVPAAGPRFRVMGHAYRGGYFDLRLAPEAPAESTLSIHVPLPPPTDEPVGLEVLTGWVIPEVAPPTLAAAP